MADDKLVQEISLEGAEQIQQLLADIGDAAERNFDKIGAAADRLNKSLDDVTKAASKTGGSSDDLKKVGDTAPGFEKASGAMGNLSAASAALRAQVSNTGEALGTFAARLGIVFGAATAAVGGIILLARSVANAINKSQEAGPSSRQLTQQVKAQEAAFTAAKVAAVNQAAAVVESQHQQQLSSEELSHQQGIEQSELKRQLALGKISQEQYTDQFVELKHKQELASSELTRKQQIESQELLRKQAIERRTAIEIAEIEREAAKQRLEDTIALQKKQQAQEAFNEAAKKFGPQLTISLIRLGEEANSVYKQFTSIFGPPIANFIDKLTGVIEENRDAILNFFKGIVDAFAPILDDATGQAATFATTVIGIAKQVATVFKSFVIPVFKQFLAFLQGVADQINQAFGTKLTGGGLLLLAVLFKLTGGLSLLIGFVRTAALAVTFLLSPFGFWLIVIALVATALYLLVTRVDWAKMIKGVVDTATAIKQYFLDLVQSVINYFSNLWTTAVNLAQAAWNLIVAAANFAWEAVKSAWNGTIQFFSDIWDAIGQAASDSWDWVKSKAKEALDGIVKFFAPVIAKIIEAWNWAKDLVASLFTAKDTAADLRGPSNVDIFNPLGSAQAQGHAMGGAIRGPGTSRSDSILARLSNGEWVINADSVRHYGNQFMHLLNTKKLPMPQFNLGGLVQTLTAPMIPRFADGGEVVAATGSRGQPVILNIGQESFQLIARENNTVERLVRFASKQQVASAGPKPSFYR